MTSIDNKDIVLDKQLLENCLKELGALLKKKGGHHRLCYELIIVGGASIVLNYCFRLSTMDVDCVDEFGLLMNEVVEEIAAKHNLPHNWINTNFVNTKSYSEKLSQYSSFYKSYANETLIVRTIKDEYLIAMKLVSARKYKNDYADIYGIIEESRNSGKEITLKSLETAIINLYGSYKNIDPLALEFVKKIIEDK